MRWPSYQVIERRGLPEDVSYRVKEKADNPDNHSFSWVNAEELQKAIFKVEAEYLKPRELLKPDKGMLVTDMDYWAVLAMLNTLGDARMVFWFDN